MTRSSQSNLQHPLRVAVITPYYREPLSILRHCHDSVRTQTYPCTHFLIADGHPQKELATWSVQHLSLAQSHDDVGATPRCLASLSAMNQGYDAIAFLDADNWYYPNHIEVMINMQRKEEAAVCTATRSLHRQDGSLMYVDRVDSNGETHVDSNCFFLTRPAFRILHLWAMMPQQLSPTGDTIVWQAIKARQFKTAHQQQPTVAYRTPYEIHYHNIGEPGFPGMKTHEDSGGKVSRWWNSQPEEVRNDWSRYLAPTPP